ncbi:MAG: hypothetical protein JTT11_08140 [Candidatus Brockarchaeota archaeon]|nr:hypothetical protein [Candidatus Brockarchaeota archaeon]
MGKKGAGCLAILVLVVTFMPPKALATDPSLDDITGTDSSDWSGPSPSTATTTTDSLAISDPFQRKNFYANGLFWVFYDVRWDTVYYRTSKDGISWSSATSLGWPTGTWYGGMFSIVFDGTYFHYAYAFDVSSGNALKYRRGTPNSDGTITWSAAEQTAVAGSSGITISQPCITLDSDGYPWIGYRRYDGTNKYPYVTKSSTKDGTWTTASGFPVRVSTFTAAGTISVPIPLTGGKMLCLYTSNGFQVKGKSCDGSGNLGSEVHTTDYIQSAQMSAVGQGDYVHLVWSDNYYIRYTKYDYSSNAFGTNSTVVSSVQSAISNWAPVLSIDAASNNLYCFYSGYPTANHIYYKIKFSSNGSWSSATDWISETTDGLTDNNRLTGFYQDHGRKIGLVYLTKGSSPYNVRFSYLDGSCDIAGKTGVMGLQAGNDAEYLAFAIKLNYTTLGFGTSGMPLGDKYEVNFTIGSMDFSMLFVATAASRGKFALCYKPGGTWTAAETIDKSGSDIASGTRYASGTGYTAFKLTDATSSDYGYVKLEVSRSYLTELGASGDSVTNIVGRTYLASSTTNLLPGPQEGTKIDRCPSGSSTASYTMKKIPEFPLGGIVLVMPLVAIYLRFRRRSAKWSAA